MLFYLNIFDYNIYMFHFFSTCRIIKTAIGNYVSHKISKYNIILKLKTFDHDVLDLNFKKKDRYFLRRPNLLRFLLKLSLLIKIKNITNVQNIIGDFYIEVKNKNGIVKKLIKNIKLKDLIINAPELNSYNKTDGVYNNLMINDLKIYNCYSNNEVNIKNIIMNVDLENDIIFRDILLYNNINFCKYNKINITTSSLETLDEEIIDDTLDKYLNRNLDKLLI